MVQQRLVPALVETIKVAGLVLVADVHIESPSSRDSHATLDGIDGLLQPNGILHFHETIDM